MSEDKVTRNAAENRYELKVGGEVAIAAYREEGDVVTFTHTEVPQALEGRGVASRLIAGALEDVRRRDLTIVPECRFVSTYVQRHSEAQGLLAR